MAAGVSDQQDQQTDDPNDLLAEPSTDGTAGFAAVVDLADLGGVEDLADIRGMLGEVTSAPGEEFAGFAATSAAGPLHCVTPCLVDSVAVTALVDSGANVPFMDEAFAEEHGYVVQQSQARVKLLGHQAEEEQAVARYTTVRELRNGSHVIRDLRVVVMKLGCDEKFVIGLSLFRQLGFEIMGVPLLPPTAVAPVEEDALPDLAESDDDEPNFPPGLTAEGYHSWATVIADNKGIAPTARCKIDDCALDIPTGQSLPVYVRQYPVPAAYEAAVDFHVREWISTGQVIAAPIDSPYNSPLLPVIKLAARGKYERGQLVEPADVRLCLDCRGLNEVISNVDCELPSVRRVQEQVSLQVPAGKFARASVIDLSKCFIQIPLRVEAQIKTTFTWRGVKYMFTVAIWGMKHVPGHVQRLMERLLRPVDALPYLDDIFRGSASDDAHATDVLRILKRITYDAGLKINFDKSKFYRTRVLLLGRLLTPEGSSIHPAKARALSQWPRPVDGKGMQRFLGAANFNREYWQDYARVTAPLESLRQVRGNIAWTPGDRRQRGAGS